METLHIGFWWGKNKNLFVTMEFRTGLFNVALGSRDDANVYKVPEVQVPCFVQQQNIRAPLPTVMRIFKAAGLAIVISSTW